MQAALALALLFGAARAGAEMGVHWTWSGHVPPWGLESVKQVLIHNNLMWVHSDGGYGGDHRLWSSSDGSTWTQAAGKFPVALGDGAQLASFKGKLWALEVSKNYYSPTSSTCRGFVSTDGTRWSQTTSTLPWQASAGRVLEFNNKLWLIDAYMKKIYSTADGDRWSLVGGDTLPLENETEQQFVVFNGKIWTLGGDGLWSTADGIQWQATLKPAPWVNLPGYSLVAAGSKLWVMGGYEGYSLPPGNMPYWAYNSDYYVWSSTDGTHWTLVTAWSDFPSAITMISPEVLKVIEYQGKMWAFDDRLSAFNPSAHEVLYSWLAPGKTQIDSRNIQNQTITEGLPYTAPRPLLRQGTPPIVWTLVNPPAGMSVDGQTGIVNWPLPLTRSKPYTVCLRAAHGYDYDQTTWTLTVTPQPPPKATMPALARGNQTTLTWSAVPNIDGYLIERADAADFKNVVDLLTVSSATQQYVFSNLADGSTWWYRVRGKTLGGVTSLWSSGVSCTQDAAPPAVWVAPDERRLEWPLTGTVRLHLSAVDPGANPAGVDQMRFSLDYVTWTPWAPYRPQATFWIGKTGGYRVYTQVRDKVGNLSEMAINCWSLEQDATFVDDDNAGGPWDGTMAHPYRKIQDALDAAKNGDTIIVAPGTYKENLMMKGKNVVLRSADPQSAEIVAATVIDGQKLGRVVTFAGSESAACVLAGFTLTHGYTNHSQSTPGGGGILGNQCHATIANNRIVDNGAAWYDGYYGPHGSSVTYCHGDGGGIAGLDGTIRNNIFASNWAGLATGTVEAYISVYYTRGSAIYQCNGDIVNNTFWNNGGATRDTECSTLENCSGTICNNIIHSSKHYDLKNCGAPSYCCLNNPALYIGYGNIGADPLLNDPAHGDFSLRADSPCIDAGAAAAGGLWDGEGDTRGVSAGLAGRGDGSGIDIGADEWLPANPGLWLEAPATGDRVTAPENVRVRWRTDAGRAGTAMWAFLMQGGAIVKNLGEVAILVADDGRGGAMGSVALPRLAGDDYRLRIVSVRNGAIWGESGPFTLAPGNAVPPAGWMGYR